MTILLGSNNFISFAIAEIICSLGTTLKGLSETQYLYASLKQTGNRSDFAKYEGKGVALHYTFESIVSIFVGALFEVNNYIPGIFTLAFLIISFITTLFFDDIKQDYIPSSNSIKDYLKDVKMVTKSKRIMSIFYYSFLMSGIVAVSITLQKSIIVNLNIPPMEYSLIFAFLTFCVGLGSKIQYIVNKIFRNKTLTFTGISLTLSIFFIGIVNIFIKNFKAELIISIILLIILNLSQGIYRMSVKKYMNNFTTSKVRGKILSVFYIFEGTGKALLLFLSGYLIDNIGTNITTLIVGVVSIVLVSLLLKYMKNKLGLNPSLYNEDDLFHEELKEIN